MKNRKNTLAALLALVMLLALGGGIAMAEAAKELPDLPEEISAVIGGLPTSFDDLPEDFDPARLKAVYEAVDPGKVIHELLENGSSTFSDGGVAWEDAALSININGDETDVDLPLSAADNGQMTVTLNDALPDTGKMDSLHFCINGPNEDALVYGYDIGTPDEFMLPQIYQANIIESTDGKVWFYVFTYNGDGSYDLNLQSEEPYRSWYIGFNEQGQIDHTDYFSDEEEEGQSTEKTELHYTPGEDLLIGELGGVKIWLKGKPNSDFGEYVEPWDAYMWYTLIIENNSDTEVLVTESGAVDGHELTLGTRVPGYSAHATEEETLTLHHFDFEDDEVWHSALNSPKTLELEIELTAVSGRYEKDFIIDYETKTPLGKLDPVIIYFDGDAAATDPAEAEPAEAEPAEAEPAADGEADPAETADSEGATYTVDDYIGTWYLNRAYLANNGYTVDVVESWDWDPYDYMVVIEPGKVTITNGDSDPGVFEGELAIIENMLVVMVDEENYYTTCVFTMVETDDGQLLAWPLTSGDISYYTKEAPKGPGKVHKDKATVKAVQQALNDAGYECGKPDGAAGKKTKAAITAYQTDKGLTVTGTVTDELLRSLGL